MLKSVLVYFIARSQMFPGMPGGAPMMMYPPGARPMMPPGEPADSPLRFARSLLALPCRMAWRPAALPVQCNAC